MWRCGGVPILAGALRTLHIHMVLTQASQTEPSLVHPPEQPLKEGGCHPILSPTSPNPEGCVPLPRAQAPNHRPSGSCCSLREGGSGRMKVPSQWRLHRPPLPKHTVKGPLTLTSSFLRSASPSALIASLPPEGARQLSNLGITSKKGAEVRSQRGAGRGISPLLPGPSLPTICIPGPCGPGLRGGKG